MTPPGEIRPPPDADPLDLFAGAARVISLERPYRALIPSEFP